MSRDAAVKSLMVQGLPQFLAEQVVGPDGSVDQAKLSVALAGISWGRQPAPQWS